MPSVSCNSVVCQQAASFLDHPRAAPHSVASSIVLKVVVPKTATDVPCPRLPWHVETPSVTSPSLRRPGAGLSDRVDVADVNRRAGLVDGDRRGRFVYAHVARLIAHLQPQVELRRPCGCPSARRNGPRSPSRWRSAARPERLGLNESDTGRTASILSSACQEMIKFPASVSTP